MRSLCCAAVNLKKASACFCDAPYDDGDDDLGVRGQCAAPAKVGQSRPRFRGRSDSEASFVHSRYNVAVPSMPPAKKKKKHIRNRVGQSLPVCVCVRAVAL
uniref:Uncharacterized protein n=1 Tax=Ixodes ricinus TaxID=34613 RepID=A0A6B0U6N0_IXORI